MLGEVEDRDPVLGDAHDEFSLDFFLDDADDGAELEAPSRSWSECCSAAGCCEAAGCCDAASSCCEAAGGRGVLDEFEDLDPVLIGDALVEFPLDFFLDDDADADAAELIAPS